MAIRHRRWTLVGTSVIIALPLLAQRRQAPARVDLPKAIAEANAVLGRVPEIRRTVAAAGGS